MAANVITVRRYCPICRHTTKHNLNTVTGRARCRANRHIGIRPFTDALRIIGFTKIWDSRAGGQRTIQYRKHIQDRDLIVQLWGDGNHRITHELRECSDTTPTDFRTLPQMHRAITRESTRKDNGWINGTKKFYAPEVK